MNCHCKFCNNPTPMLGTQMCNRCWELEHRIRQDFEIAEKIFNHVMVEIVEGRKVAMKPKPWDSILDHTASDPEKNL